MTWSNVGSEPGRDKFSQPKGKGKGVNVRLVGPMHATPGHSTPETPQARAQRLRAIARGKRP